MVASQVFSTGDLAGNPSMCPDWESNQHPFGLQAGAQSTEPHQPGLYLLSYLFTFQEVTQKKNFSVPNGQVWVTGLFAQSLASRKDYCDFET